MKSPIFTRVLLYLQLGNLLICNGIVYYVSAQQAAVVDLDCRDFDTSCAWHNMQSPAPPLMWFRSSANITKDQMAMTTGTDQTPNVSYAIAASISVNESMYACLVSDPVPCQAANGTITFKYGCYWTSPFVLLKVCQHIQGQPFNKTANCWRTPLSQGPGPANITIPPCRTPFVLMIEAGNFVFSNGQLIGGFAIIDNVNYTGDFCITPPANASANATSSNSTVSGNATTVSSSGTANSSTNATAAGGNATVSGGGNSTVSNATNSTARPVVATTAANIISSVVGSSTNNTQISSASNNNNGTSAVGGSGSGNATSTSTNSSNNGTSALGTGVTTNSNVNSTTMASSNSG